MPITARLLKELLTAPHETLAKVAKEKNANEALVMLVIDWIFLSLALGLPSQNFSLIPLVLTGGIIGTLVVAFFTQTILTTLGGKGDFTGALIAFVYPFFGVAFSSLLISVIFRWQEKVAVALGALLFTLYFAIAFAGAFRVLKESFKLDIVTIWVAVSLLMLAVGATFYLTLAIYISRSVSLSSLLQLFSSFRTTSLPL
ncbi:MAG: hypothetical protein LM587_00945 [Candidatus Aenigmarchaeota archaeon]|nr:hypothetical protein [Candidatus Aenigmarchaeota archaeon]